MSREIFCGVWVTEHRKAGKMINKDSIMLSHPSFCDRECGICGHCYSKRMSKYRRRLKAKQEQNTERLNSRLFTPSKLNTIDGSLRWISTGELHSRQMYKNIIKMVNLNNHLTHALWTKRNGLIVGIEKPDNLNLVWSSTMIDYKDPFIPAGYDIGFFVYSDYDKIPVDREMIHCHKKCSECGFCYEPNAHGIVAEVMK